ncbi:GntR family transcriptional regulator [Kineococcus sp. NPDC059986]|uniref:GntR family transcriptional regulator n=1 Tax=Kineococcus sp. NPDC059986 TaxID=3155538 RepID=UPI00344E2B82
MSSAELLGDTVYADLLERVVDGRLPPGTVLSVAALAVELGVSRSPVRESVQRLITEGIAVTSAHSAARVATVGPSELEEVLRVREVLDGLAAAEATNRADAEGVRRLVEALAEHERTLGDPPDPAVDAALDVRFHALLRQLSGNATLADTLRRLEVRAHLFGAGLWTDRRHRELAVAEHRRIVEAVEAGDVEAARRNAAAHVAALAVRLRRATR